MSLQETPPTLAHHTKVPKRSRPSLARMSQMERRAEALLQRPDTLSSLAESARDYSKQGLAQLRRLQFWMRRQIQTRATAAPTVPDELAERRELRRMRELSAPALGTTAVQPIGVLGEVTEESALAPTHEYITPIPRGLSLRDTYPDVEDLSQLTPTQILGWIGQDEKLSP